MVLLQIEIAMGIVGTLAAPLPIPMRSDIAFFSVHVFFSLRWSLMVVWCCDPSPNVLA